jgi:hypothetical protein
LANENIGITANCNKILRRLAAANGRLSEALHNRGRRRWDLLNYDQPTKQVGEGDDKTEEFDYDKPPAYDEGFNLNIVIEQGEEGVEHNSKVKDLFDREDAAAMYAKAHTDTEGNDNPPLSKLTAAVLSSKSQIDVLSAIERDYRARYMRTRMRHIAHDTARREGHSSFSGPILYDVVNWILGLSTPPRTGEGDGE